LNIQTERLDNHTARLTVEVEAEQLDQAKQKAARRLSQKVNLPGFRKGKAPYHIIVRFLGEPAILEEAVELISNDVYPTALTEAGIDPYGPGALEDFTNEPLAIVFSVPLAPTVDLKDYRSLRQPYTPRVVTDRDVESGLKRMLQGEAEVQPSEDPAAMGDRVTLDIHSHIHTEGEEGHGGGDFIHEHGLHHVLDEAEDPLPGFSAKILGAKPGDRLDFELTVPEDSDEYVEERGKTVHFEVGVGEVVHITMPELNDEFAARVSADEDEPQTLDQLRERVRTDLERVAEDTVNEAYANKLLDTITEQADIRYPEAMVADQVQSMLESMDQQLRRQGMNLEDYKKLLNKTDEDLFNDYRDVAITRLRRGLARRTLFEVEGLAPSDAQLEAEFDRITGNVDGEQRAVIRSMFESQGFADAVREQLADRLVRERLVAIGKGEAPDLPAADATSEETNTPTESEEETA